MCCVVARSSRGEESGSGSGDDLFGRQEQSTRVLEQTLRL
jgi:hypothetical protein